MFFDGQLASSTEVSSEDEYKKLRKEFCCGGWLPLCGEETCKSTCGIVPTCEDNSHKWMDHKLLPIELHLRALMDQADILQSDLDNSLSHSEKEAAEKEVQRLLDISQPFFRYLESTARSRMTVETPPPSYICTELLDFSHQLCMRLEQLVLYYAVNNILSLDQTIHPSPSHFYIGQCQIDKVLVTMFRCCGPVPYDARADTVMYTRMRWNVEWLLQTGSGDDGEQNEDSIFFLCYEDTPQITSRKGETISTGGVVRKWTIGTASWFSSCDIPIPKGEYKLGCDLDVEGQEDVSTRDATGYLLTMLRIEHV